MQVTELQSLGKLFDAYISDRKVFRCPSDNSVSEANNLGLSTTNTDFTTSRCSYGYDDNHTATNDPGTAIAADKLGTSTTLSANHGQKGQNVLYIDGHVEWKGTETCGYYNSSSYDKIYYNLSTANRTQSTVGTTLQSCNNLFLNILLKRVIFFSNITLFCYLLINL